MSFIKRVNYFLIFLLSINLSFSAIVSQDNSGFIIEDQIPFDVGSISGIGCDRGNNGFNTPGTFCVRSEQELSNACGGRSVIFEESKRKIFFSDTNPTPLKCNRLDYRFCGTCEGGSQLIDKNSFPQGVDVCPITRLSAGLFGIGSVQRNNIFINQYSKSKCETRPGETFKVSWVVDPSVTDCTLSVFSADGDLNTPALFSNKYNAPLNSADIEINSLGKFFVRLSCNVVNFNGAPISGGIVEILHHVSGPSVSGEPPQKLPYITSISTSSPVTQREDLGISASITRGDPTLCKVFKKEPLSSIFKSFDKIKFDKFNGVSFSGFTIDRLDLVGEYEYKIVCDGEDYSITPVTVTPLNGNPTIDFDLPNDPGPSIKKNQPFLIGWSSREAEFCIQTKEIILNDGSSAFRDGWKTKIVGAATSGTVEVQPVVSGIHTWYITCENIKGTKFRNGITKTVI